MSRIFNYKSEAINDLDLFMENVELNYAFYESAFTYYTVLRIYKKRTDGLLQYPFVRKPDTSKPASEIALDEGWFLVINGGIGQGLVIENSTLITDTPASRHEGAMPITIDENGDLSYTSSDTSGKGNILISQGIVSAVCGFYPIIVDYEEYDFPDLPYTTELPEWQHAQRQIIGQFGNGDYAIITSQGRGDEASIGLSMEEAQSLCKNLGLKFAYNLDGGGSIQTVIGKKFLNDIGNSVRDLPTVICFNGKTSFSI